MNDGNNNYLKKPLLRRLANMSKKTKEKERYPLATGFLSKGNLYFNHNCKFVKEHSSYNKLGVALMDFAWLDYDLLQKIFSIMWSRYILHKNNGDDYDTIAFSILKTCDRFLRVNSYLFIYIMVAMDILMDSNIDRRIFTYENEVSELDALAINDQDPSCEMSYDDKQELLDLLIICIKERQSIVEDALNKILADENNDAGQSAMKRLCRLQEEDEFFRKYWHSNFETRIDRITEDANVYANLTILSTIDDMMRYELVQIILRNVKYKRCQSCGKLFLPVRRKNALYCNRIMPGQKRPCSEVGANLVAVEKRNAHPVLRTYRQAYNRMYKRAQEEYMGWSDFHKWNEQAVNKRNTCQAGNLSYNDFMKWIDETSRQR